jgi:hypothetical protein
MAIGFSPFTPTSLDRDEDRTRNPKEPRDPVRDLAVERVERPVPPKPAVPADDPIEDAIPPVPQSR